MKDIKLIIYFVSLPILSVTSLVLLISFIKYEYKRMGSFLLGTKIKTKLLLKLSIMWLLVGFILSFIFTSSIIYGFLFIFAFPILLRIIMKIYYAFFENHLERTAILTLHALLGLLKTGLGLPSALFKLIERVDSPFTQALKPFLLKYEKGKTLSECLLKFSRKISTLQIGMCLNVFEIAYSKGLPLVPFLEYIIPVLEDEIELKEKIASQRKMVIAELIIALIIPWIIFLSLNFFETNFLFELSINNIALIVGAFLWEILGFYAIWKVSSFC